MSDTVIMENPTLEGQRAVVRTRAVDAWSRAGWRPVEDATPGPSTHYLVLAGSAADAKAWARENDVSQADYTYASTADAVAGVDPTGLQVVELPSFAGHRNEADIRTAAAAVFTATPEPTPAEA